MIVIIDGYNLLKQVFPCQKTTLGKHRDYFIRQLASYKANKETSIKDIVVVFDAGPSNHATRSVKSGIVVVYSGTDSSADDWIIDYIERTKGKEMLLVTRDRALRERGQKLDVDWINVHDFYKLVLDGLAQPGKKRIVVHDTALHKFTSNYADDFEMNNVDEEFVNMLMEQASITTPHKKDDISTSCTQDKANKASKQERRLQAKIKKL